MSVQIHPEPSNVRPGHRDPHAHAAHQPFEYPLDARVRGARLDAAPRLRGRHDRAVGERAVAARPHREEPQGVQGGAGRLPGRRPHGGHRARPAGARHDVDADPAADDQHDGGARPPSRPGAQLHGAGAQRPADRMDEPPDVVPRLAARGRDVGRGGPHPPLPDEGARRADPDVPAVLRPLHADGPGRQRHAPGPEVQVRGQAERPLGPDARLPAAAHPRCATSSSRAATWRTSRSSGSRTSCRSCWTSRTSATSASHRRV